MSYKNTALLLLLLTFLSGNFNINRIIMNLSFEVRYILFAASIFTVLIGISYSKRNISIKINKSVILFILLSFTYLLQVLISFFYTIDQSRAIGKVELSIFLILLIIGNLLIVNSMEVQEFFKVVSIFFISIGILYAIPIYLDVFSGASRGDTSVSGPNVATRILFFACCSAIYRFSLNKKTLYLILSILFLFSIVLVGSRGGFLGALLSLLLVLTIKKTLVDWKGKMNISINFSLKYISFLIPCLLILYFMFEPIKRVFMGRFIGSTFQSGTVYSSGRNVIYSDAILMIKEKPIIGYGIDSFTLKTGHVYPHNLLLEMLVEIGMLGAIIFVFFVFFSVFIIFKMRKSSYFIFSSIPVYMIVVQMFSGEFYDFRYFFLWMIPLLYGKAKGSRTVSMSYIKYKS
ncbi:O-antigen ligase family protein [Metabacillus iocasae]|uniref:O-antigen ligase n=1 Tax=Priestia iocasae TaxID=2291674 RepID=A0ABS2QUZ2_9BACI|nr:O-antigen ligase family protein [Metabacillus iocasae]MBM7702304.1 O-antigen ligase [Metabacillus iocasae]